VKLGKSREQFEDEALANDRAAAHLSRQHDEQRALDRAWKNACKVAEPAFDNLEADEEPKRPRIVFRPYDPPPFHQIPRRQFLYGTSLARGFVSATVAPGGAGKTALVITEVLAMTSGLALLGDKPAGPLRVGVFNFEDDFDEMLRRVAAAELHFAKLLEGTGFRDRLFILGAEHALKIGRMVNGVAKIDEAAVRETIAEVLDKRLDVLIADPFVSMHGVPESDNDAVDRILKDGCGRIAREGRCAVWIQHHTRKPPAGAGEMGYRVEDSRGASALINAVRHARVVNRMSREEAVRFGVSPDEAWRYLRIDPGKANLAPPSAATWRQFVEVRLPNSSSFEADDGDRVGVVEAWTPPDLGETSRDERTAIVEALAGAAWRASSQAEGWVGVAVARALNLDLDKPAHRATATAKVKAGLKDGWLVEFRDVEGRKERPMIRAARRTPTTRELIG
jgi:hypothetical protein